MKIIADANVLLRAALPDDEGRRGPAMKALLSADTVAVRVHALCEFVWVMSQRCRATRNEIGTWVRRPVDTPDVVVDRPAVAAGLALLDAGGDFADGVIAHEGRWLGGETFVSFDREAVRLVEAAGGTARVLT